MSAQWPTTLPTPHAETSRRSFGILSTFPPTACGLATFSAALSKELVAGGADVAIVRIVEGAFVRNDAVDGELVNNSPQSVRDCASLLNRCDVALIQHEYGVYGGTDGDEVLQVLAGLEVPSIVFAHTVLKNPTAHQRSVLVSVAAQADRVVVMSEAARERLCERFGVAPSKVVTIPHGATVPTMLPPGDTGGRPTILTWGLLGPGKGIDRVIDALSTLSDLSPKPRYLIAGQTHPKVLAADGERYRTSLIEHARRIGVGESVSFDATYRDVASLTSLVQSCAVAVLPYDSTDQVTSGVLVDAIAAGRPVIATAFPHAVELLASGAGIVVDHDDASGLADALRMVLTDRTRAGQMQAEACRLAPGLSWPVVASEIVRLADQVVAQRPVMV